MRGFRLQMIGRLVVRYGGARCLLTGVLLLCAPPLPAGVEVLYRSSEVPVPLVGIGLLVLLIAVHLVVRLNHRLRIEIRSRWHAEDQLSESQQRLSLALWGADLGSWDWNLDSGELWLDQRAADLLGVAAGEGVLNLMDRHPACELFLGLRERVCGSEPGYNLEQVVAHDQRWLRVAGKRLRHANAAYRALGTLMDVTEAHRYQEKLERLSITDALTGLHNRRHFFERLGPVCAQARRDASPLAVAMIDIDHFKSINDDHGHQVGDLVLRHVAGLLTSHCRPYDLVARYGGEEFVVLFVGIDRRQAAGVLARYRDALAAAPLQQGRIICRFSAGIADLCEAAVEEQNCESLIGVADRRLYQAKTAGRDQIRVDDNPADQD